MADLLGIAGDDLRGLPLHLSESFHPPGDVVHGKGVVNPVGLHHLGKMGAKGIKIFPGGAHGDMPEPPVGPQAGAERNPEGVTLAPAPPGRIRIEELFRGHGAGGIDLGYLLVHIRARADFKKLDVACRPRLGH